MDFHLDSLLNLPNVTVLSCQQQEGLIFLSLELLNDGIPCPHCQTYTDNLHQTRPIQLNYYNGKNGLEKIKKMVDLCSYYARKSR